MAQQIDNFYLQVLAADKRFFHDRAKSLSFETWDGRVEFLAWHEQTIMAVEAGELDILTMNGGKISVLVGPGAMVFANNRATVLVETCETREELDARRAREALERAEERLRQKQSIVEYRMSQAAMARALMRLKFKGKEFRN